MVLFTLLRLQKVLHLLVPHRQSVDPSDAVSRDADADTLTFAGTFLAALSAPKHVRDLQVSRSNYLMGNICQFSHSCCEGDRRSISGVLLSFVGITSIRGYFPQGYFVLVGRAGHCKPNMCGALCSTRIIQQTLNICLFTRPSDNEWCIMFDGKIFMYLWFDFPLPTSPRMIHGPLAARRATMFTVERTCSDSSGRCWEQWGRTKTQRSLIGTAKSNPDSPFSTMNP